MRNENAVDFMTQILSDIQDEIVRWLKKTWFEAKLKACLQMIEWQNLRETEEERKERFKPVYQEKPVDPVLQTGESQLLVVKCVWRLSG